MNIISTKLTSEQTRFRDSWNTDGFTIAKGLALQAVSSLQQETERIFSQYLDRDPDTGLAGDSDCNMMRYLHRPEYFSSNSNSSRILLEFAASATVLRFVESLLGEKPVFQDLSLIFNPFFSHRDGHWHRDIQYFLRSEDAERHKIEGERRQKISAVQLHVALSSSSDVEYVGGSHARWDTSAEYKIRIGDNFANMRSNEMPNSERIFLEPGDALALNPIGMHRGRSHADKFRRHLMVTYTCIDNIADYYSEQPWMLNSSYFAELNKDTQEYFSWRHNVVSQKLRLAGNQLQ